MLGELGADRHALAGVEAVERALDDMALDARQARQIAAANAAHQRARRAIGRARERLALDQRQRQRDARNLADALGHRIVVGERRLDPLQEHVAVEADHLVHEIVAKAVHHRHDDDQRRDAEHDAKEREAGDDRDRALGVARAKIAKRDHPFEGGERLGGRRRLGSGRLHRDGGQSAPRGWRDAARLRRRWRRSGRMGPRQAARRTLVPTPRLAGDEARREKWPTRMRASRLVTPARRAGRSPHRR